MTFPDPAPWSDDELRDMRLEPVNEVIKILGDIEPLPADDEFVQKMNRNNYIEDDVGQRLAALRFEITACDALQVDDLNAADELLTGLREEYDFLGQVIRGWSECVAGGVG